MDELLEDLRAALAAKAHPATLASSQKFFREGVKAYGVKTPDAKAIAKPLLAALKTTPKPEIFELCEELWLSGYLEESIIACELSLSQKKHFEPTDFQIFEHWIASYVNNWASCDTFCNHTVGELLLKFPELAPRLKTWASGENRWARRAAAVSLILPARKGKFLDLVFDIARTELEDADDMVQKGYGWLLKSAAAKHEQQVFDFVIEHKTRMPRTALRYAIEKMDAQHKKAAMAR